MTEPVGEDHFIPLRKAELAGLLASQGADADRQEWLRFFGISSALFHHYFQVQLDHLKDLYAPFDPDTDTRPLTDLDPAAELEQESAFFELLERLLQQGNFRQIAWEQVATGQVRRSRLGLQMRMDPSVFERLEIHVRGESVMERKRENWWKLWEPKRYKVPIHHRMLLALRLKPRPEITGDLPREGIHLKLFRRVPKEDLEMLLPGSRLRLSGLDKGLVGFPLVTGVIMLLGNALLAILSAGFGVLGSLLSWSAAIALGGYGFRSYSAWKSKRMHYNLRVSKHLYFQKLDSNLGAVLRLVDEAEEQECREAWLAYHVLVNHAPAAGWTATQLEAHCAGWLTGVLDHRAGFEVGDALGKLLRLEVVAEEAGLYRALPLREAVLKLDAIWDGLFPTNAHTMNEGACRLAEKLGDGKITKVLNPRF